MPVIETHPASGTGILPEERIAVREVTPQEAEEALRRGHHTHVMTQPAPKPAGRRTRRKPGGGSRKQHAKAGQKGARRVRKLIEEGQKYEEEHGRQRPKKGRRTKRKANRRPVKAGAKSAAPRAKARRPKASAKAK
jgi:hypothetical protein